MEIGIWGVLGGVITTFATAATAAFFTRRQSKVEIEKLEQEVATMAAQRDSEQKSADFEMVERFNRFQAGLMDSLKKEITDLRSEYDKSRQENLERREYADKLRIEVDQLHRTIEYNKKQSDREIALLRKELKTMKDEFPCVDCPRRLARK
jgi:predicted  nucleic acid-binding Zn-ribbon protein